MAASSLGQGEIAMEDVGRSSRQDDQITGEGQGEKAIAMEDVGQSSRQDDQITGEGQGEIAIAMEDVGQSSRQDDQITGEGAHENNAGDTGEGQGEIAIAMEDVGQSSRQDDQITGEGAHENNAGDTGAGDTKKGDLRMDPLLYRYATTYKSGVIYTGIPRYIKLLVKKSENKVSIRGNTMLHLAANTGQVQLIELITRTFSELVRKRNQDGELPLHVAASAGHLSAVRKLVACMEGDTAQGNTFNEEDERGNTALHVAVENNHQDVAMFLVSEDGSGSTLHSTNKSGKTPLCMAVETANLELVKAMVDKKPNSTADANSGNFWQGSNGNSILHSAIIRRKQAKGGLKKYDTVLVLVMLVLWYNNISLYVLLPVVWAWVTSMAKGGLKKYDVVFVLVILMLWYIKILSHFVLLRALSWSLKLAWIVLAGVVLAGIALVGVALVGFVCWSKVSQWCLPRTNRKKYTSMPLSLLFSIAVLLLATFISRAKINQKFVMAGVVCWIFFMSIVSQWWLPRTYRKKYTNLLETILKNMNSADLINSTDQGWMSPLTVAAYMDNFVAVHILLHKYKLTELAYKGDENQLLPIHVASKKGHCRVVEEFLNRCPDLRESSDPEGRNILHLAAAHGRVDVVRYIIGKCDLQVLSKQRDQSGNTPLHIAVQNWHPKIVKILSLFHAYERANLNSLNNAGETALDLAEKTGVDKEMLFRRKLTLMALNLANAPRSGERTVSKETEDSVPKSLHNSDNLTFSKESVNTLLLVSTVVVGITFAQAFTVPGGYSDSGKDLGTPNFLPHCLFRIFLICNTVAMCGSITASVALMWAQTYDPSIIHGAMRFTLPVLGVTLTMMSSSFLAGVALTVYHVVWLRIFVYAMGLSFTVFIVGLLAPLIDLPVSYETVPTRAILFFCFDLLMFVSGYN